MSLNSKVQKLHLEAQALQNAPLQDKVKFVKRLVADAKSVHEEQTKKQILETFRGYNNPLVDASAVEHSLLVINKVWNPAPTARATMVNRPFDGIVKNLEGITLTDEEKEKGITFLFHSLRDLDNQLNGGERFEHDLHEFA